LSRQILSRSTSVNIATFHAKVPETVMARTLSVVITPYMRTVLKDLHELTAVSLPAAEYVSSLTDRPITIIQNGIDVQHFTFTPRARAASPRTIVYIGRLEQRKGVKYLLRAYARLAQDLEGTVRLLIAGDGADRRKLTLLAEELQIPNVEFLGYISDEQKVALLASADLFCSPALYGESFGVVLLEAMASGLPIVAGDNSGYESVLRELGTLSLVNPKDEIDFARRMRVLLEEPKLRALWQTWARSYIKQFTYEKVVDQYERLYRKALRKYAGSPVHAR
ncbi:MAG TPA: glycosyltransferase family 4 protein, partial [Candidatus Saccharimonadales bacterium]|nr:glycosyltransferase family 4 protein [Candidatus Saccharimonadales bacterium]